jgi:non-specific serine/threonine protein kinase/serine/threonine-protein kinase
MMPNRWQQAEALFHEVVDLDASAREERLQKEDAELRAEVLALVEAFDAAPELEPLHGAAPAAQTPETLGTIGPYQLERELGEGGMGTVYLGTRADQQYDKKVAIKLIRSGPGARALIDRFYRERQILAGMEHPNIARMLDGGLNEFGHPYIVMDYVEGQRLDRHCDENRLSVRERLELFRKVCAAVAYAHQHLVIHRDLKPSNILVTTEGEPKLLDFGIATVMRAQTAGADLTVTAGLFLTPLYASPELVRGARVSVSSDVYSLGVILYELLCGRSPYHPFTLSPAQLIHAITTADPNFPSSPATPSADDSLSPEEIAAARRLTPAGLAAALRGEVDSIVLKALAKDPVERYRSVEQLSDDIGRYLAGEPVEAVRAGSWYMAKKFVMRHRVGVAAAAAIVVLLAAGVAGTTWQARVAEQRFRDTRQLAKYLLFDLYDSVQRLPGSTPVQAAMAVESLAYLDRLSANKTSDRELQTEVAEGYFRTGNVLGNPVGPNLGKGADALASYRKALALIEPLCVPPGRDRRAELLRARVLLNLGAMRTFAFTSEAEGIETVRRAVKAFEALHAAAPGDRELLIESASSQQILARQLSQSGGWVSGAVAPEAEALIVRARELFLSIPAAERDTGVLKHLALNHTIHSAIRERADPHAALTDSTKALDYFAQIKEADRETLEIRRLRAATLLTRGWGRGQVSDFTGAVQDLEEGKTILVAISDADPKNMAAIYHCTNAYRSLGIVHGYAKNREAAIASYRQAVKLFDRLIKGEPSNTHHPLHRAEALIRIGDLLALTGRMAEALPAAREGLAYMIKMAERPGASDPQLLDAARWLLETQVTNLRDPKMALTFVQRTDPKADFRDEYLAESLFQTGDAAGAIAAIDRLIATLKPTPPGEKPSRARAELEGSRTRYVAAIRAPKK